MKNENRRIAIYLDEVNSIIEAIELYRGQIEYGIEDDYYSYAMNQMRLLGNIVKRYRKPIRRHILNHIK